MQDINTIYHNAFGVAFQWANNKKKNTNKVQLVFRDTGLMLTKEKLFQFSKNIKHTKENSVLCVDCAQKESRKTLLIDSPAPQITFAMNMRELNDIEDLVDGALFQLNLDAYLNKMYKD